MRSALQQHSTSQHRVWFRVSQMLPTMEVIISLDIGS